MGTLTKAHKEEMNNLLIHNLFELQNNNTPDALAVIFGNQSLTYSKLGQKADSLAAAILASSPASLNAGVSTHRAVETIISVIAILKSGKAYLPLDPDYPQDRLQQIVSDSGIDICLSLSAQKQLFEPLGIK